VDEIKRWWESNQSDGSRLKTFNSKRSLRIRDFYSNFIQTREMVKMEEEKPLTNKEETKEKNENSLLNYEYDEDDDGVDWET